MRTHPPRAASYSGYQLRHLRRAIGLRIHEERMRQRTTLTRLAKTSGVPEWRIDQFELGKNEIGLEDMLRLTSALGLAINQLF